MKQNEIEHLLPGVFQRTLRQNSSLAAVLAVMEALHAPSEDVVQRLDSTFDPRRTAADFVPFLARWVDLDWLFEATGSRGQVSQCRSTVTTGLARLRELIARASLLSQWRGTAKGLVLFLETATGMTGFVVNEQVTENGRQRGFHVHIRGPAEAAPHRRMIERIINSEKPAYVTFDLDFEPAQGER